MRRAAVLVVGLGLAVASCNQGGPPGLDQKLLSITTVFEGPVSAYEFLGEDVYAQIGSDGQPTGSDIPVSVYRVDLSAVSQFPVWPSGELSGDKADFFRDPAFLRDLGGMAAAGDSLVIMFQPAIIPSLGEVAFEGFVVVLDEAGKVVDSDYTGVEAADLNLVVSQAAELGLTLGDALSRLARAAGEKQLGLPFSDPVGESLLAMLTG